MNRRFMADQYLINRFRGARTDPSLVVLEGFHPLKHALRFGAEILEAVAVDAGVVEQLGASLAPDIVPSSRKSSPPSLPRCSRSWRRCRRPPE